MSDHDCAFIQYFTNKSLSVKPYCLKKKHPQFGPYVLCWVDLDWRVHANEKVKTPGDTVSQADGMELIAVNTSG